MQALLWVGLWLVVDVLLLVALARVAARIRSVGGRQADAQPTPTAIRLRGGLTAPARARTELAPLLAACDNGVAYQAMLLLSELVNNSVVHDGAGDSELIAIRVHAADAAVRVEVLNRRRRFSPGSKHGGAPPGAGRGLQVVDGLAESWGIEHGDVSRAWFELRTSHDSGRREAVGTI